VSSDFGPGRSVVGSHSSRRANSGPPNPLVMVEDGSDTSIQSRQLTDLGLPLLNCRRLALCVAPGLGATIFSAKQHLKTRECEGL
jgi:hypothetical protein